VIGCGTLTASLSEQYVVLHDSICLNIVSRSGQPLRGSPFARGGAVMVYRCLIGIGDALSGFFDFLPFFFLMLMMDQFFFRSIGWVPFDFPLGSHLPP